MKSMQIKGTMFGIIGATALLMGCSGGGGGGGSTAFTPPNISNTPISIDTNNQYEVANTAENSANGTIDGSTGVIGVVVGGDNKSHSAFGFIKKFVLDSADNSTAASVVGPAGIEIKNNCDVAPNGTTGTETITTNVDLNTTRILSVGDYVNLSYDNCFDAEDAETNNGIATLTIMSGALDFNLADPLSGTLSISLDFDNMRSTEAGETSILHGDATMAVNSSQISISGDSLYFMVVGGEAAHITNFVMTSSTSGSTKTMTINATIASTDINGVVTVQTAAGAPLMQEMSDEHPSSGTLIITGGSTTLTMMIISSTQVNLSLDSDSDGTPNAGYPVTVTWTMVDNGAAANP